MATHLRLLCFWLSFFLISNMQVSADQSNNYIIYMDLMAMPKAFTDHHSWYLATLLSSLLDNPRLTTCAIPRTPSSLSSKLIYSYTHVLNGFSANLLPDELEALKASPGYIYSAKDLLVKSATTHTTKFLGLNSNFGAWPVSNYGEDVIIGFVDSGIWPESESFNDHGMSEIPSRWKGECENGTQFNSSLCNKKLIGARFFNKAQSDMTNNIIPIMNSPRDTDGHGTLVASTGAGSFVNGASYFGYGSGTARGVAPRARVAIYKALWNESAFYTSDILGAMDHAIKDGVDVLSLSFGLHEFRLHKNPIAIASFSAMEKGIFVSLSGGNKGPAFKTLHNGAPWDLTVAAGRMDREFVGIVNLENGVSVRGWSLYPGINSSSSTPAYLPIVYMNECKDLKELQKIGNKFVVCEEKEDGTNSLSLQTHTLQISQVAGGVFITNNTKLELFIETKFPAAFLNPTNGEVVKDYINSKSNPKASLESNITMVGMKQTPSVAAYSGRGPSNFCPTILKPDIMAPGSLILASTSKYKPVTWLNNEEVYNSFAIRSGTSLACPIAAGVAALLKSAHPEWSPAAIRSAIMTTSEALDNTINPIKDVAYGNQSASPLAMGAGHINPNRALDPGLVYDAGREDYINYLCALNYSQTFIKLITRSDSFDCSTPSLDLNYPSFIAFFNSRNSNPKPTKVQEFHRTVTNVGEGRATYVASWTSMNWFEVKVVPDKLVFKEKNEKLSFKLSIEGPSVMKERVVSGYLSWVDNEKKYEVRSPIVATNIFMWKLIT